MLKSAHESADCTEVFICFHCHRRHRSTAAYGVRSTRERGFGSEPAGGLWARDSVAQTCRSLIPQDPSVNYLLGAALLQSGQTAEAVAPLRVASEATPPIEAAEGYLGDAEMELQQFFLAADAFESAVVRSPDSEQALVWWTDFSLERYRVLEFSLRASPRGRVALLQLAAAQDNVEWKRREELLKQAAAMYPELSGVWGQLGLAQAKLGMEADAETSLQSARQNQPDDSSTLELQATVDATRGNWPEAGSKLLDLAQRSQAEFAKFRVAWPRTLYPAQEMKGTIWQCLREAKPDCSTVVSEARQPDGLPPQRLFAEGRWKRLIALPAPPTAKAPGANEPTANEKDWFWRGFAFAELGDCPHAIPALERGVKAGAEEAAARLANCYQGQAVLAADHLQTLGNAASVHQIRGDIQLSIRLDPASAAAEYGEALNLKPKDPELLEKLAEALYSQGEFAKARQAAQQALEQNPHRKQLLQLLIRVAMNERDYSTALSLLEQLAAMQPADPWIRIQQATAYAQTGRPGEAVLKLQPALDAGYPDEKGALHAMLAAQLRKLGRDHDAKIASDEAIRLADDFAQQTRSAPQDQP
jgi:tetratricopeptide (TPR) repeat protein